MSNICLKVMLLVVNIFYFHHEYIINFGSAALGERERERERLEFLMDYGVKVSDDWKASNLTKKRNSRSCLTHHSFSAAV